MTENCSALLDQLGLLVRQMTSETFQQPLRVLHQATIGGHVRHSLEFFICLVGQYENGTVNYDLRQRDVALETNPDAAMVAIGEIRKKLKAISGDMPLTLLTSLNGETDASSSLNRELIYVCEHAIHHMALIKSGLLELPDEYQLPDSFGIAASTLNYRKKILANS